MLLLYTAFVLTGVVTTLLGPMLPILAARWALDDWQAGLLFTTQFLGSMVGVALSSVGMRRLGFRTTLVIGVTLMGAGVAALGADAFSSGVAAVFCYGTGLGLTIPTTNLAVADANPTQRASALNVLNLAWGLGAVSAPPVVALFQRAGQARGFLLLLAALLALTALALLRMRLGGADAAQYEGAVPDRSEIQAVSRWHRGVLVFGGLLFVYVGTETALAGWVAVYARRLELVSATASISAPSFFWAPLLVGRALAPAVLRRVPETRLVGAGLVLATAGVALLLVAGSAGTLVLAVALGGLGLATVFPITVSLFARDCGREASRLAGLVFALASLGGAALPSLVGIISTRAGSLKAGLLVPLVGCLVMLALLGWRDRIFGRGAHADVGRQEY